MDKRLLEFAVEIAQAQVALSKMTADEIESVLLRVYNALCKMQQAEIEGRLVSIEGGGVEGKGGQGEEGHIDPRNSIQEDKVVCLECGGEFRQLTANHLKTHGLTPRDYKRKWGFPLKQPLAARSLTKMRSKSAKKRGLPQRLQQYLEDQRRKKKGGGPEEEENGRGTPRKTAARGAA